jgi:hypothetical protein
MYTYPQPYCTGSHGAGKTTLIRHVQLSFLQLEAKADRQLLAPFAKLAILATIAGFASAILDYDVVEQGALPKETIRLATELMTMQKRRVLHRESKLHVSDCHTPPSLSVIQPCRGLSWSVVVCRGLSWSVVVCRGLSWSVVVCRGLSWSVVVCRGLSAVSHS